MVVAIMRLYCNLGQLHSNITILDENSMHRRLSMLIHLLVFQVIWRGYFGFSERADKFYVSKSRLQIPDNNDILHYYLLYLFIYYIYLLFLLYMTSVK